MNLVDSNIDADQIASSKFNRCPKYDVGGYFASNFYFVPDFGYQFSGFDGTNNYSAALDDLSPRGLSFDLSPAPVGW